MVYYAERAILKLISRLWAMLFLWKPHEKQRVGVSTKGLEFRHSLQFFNHADGGARSITFVVCTLSALGKLPGSRDVLDGSHVFRRVSLCESRWPTFTTLKHPIPSFVPFPFMDYPISPHAGDYTVGDDKALPQATQKRWRLWFPAPKALYD